MSGKRKEEKGEERSERIWKFPCGWINLYMISGSYGHNHICINLNLILHSSTNVFSNGCK